MTTLMMPSFDLKSPEELVLVTHGVNQCSFPLAGHTVKEIKKNFREVLNVSKDATTLIGNSNTRVDDSYIVNSGDMVEFLQPKGIKG